MLKKRSFFSKLAGDDDTDFYDDEKFAPGSKPAVFHGQGGERHAHLSTKGESWAKDDEDVAGELAVDVYQTPDSIVIKAFIAGVQPNSVDISLTRETLTMSGTRSDEKEVEEDGYFQRELYWGSFSRTILLPEEVDVDMAEASEKHGILVIRLPKINKNRQTKLKVRTR